MKSGQDIERLPAVACGSLCQIEMLLLTCLTSCTSLAPPFPSLLPPLLLFGYQISPSICKTTTQLDNFNSQPEFIETNSEVKTNP